MKTSLECSIRPLTPTDQPFLWEMVYQAIHVPPGDPPLPRNIVNDPDIAKYGKAWGQKDDLGFVAEVSDGGRSIGAAWLRLLKSDNKGYGYVNDRTPELSIAVLPDYRDKGVGTQLLNYLLEAAKAVYPSLSLSVSSDNPVLRMYKRMGFKVVGEYDTSLTMKINLNR